MCSGSPSLYFLFRSSSTVAVAGRPTYLVPVSQVFVMMTNSADASPPFDHAKADIILRSSDNVNFRVFKLFLSLASPFFETLFDIPQPADADADQEAKDGLIVVPVAEDSKTLDALLRFCYPCTLADDPTLEALEDAADVLEAARKYSLDVIEMKARKAIMNPKILEAEPLRCFVIAHQGRLQEETILAARYTLTQPLIPTWFQELERISAADFLALLTYHKRCGEAVYALRANSQWISSHYGGLEGVNWLLSRRPGCRCQSSAASRPICGHQPLQWWEGFMEAAFTELRDRPCKNSVQAAAETTIQIVRQQNCPSCTPRIAENMQAFSDLLARKVDETVSQIELELNF